FKEYLGKTSYQNLKRERNYFVCSKYTDGESYYFAVLGNFWNISNKEDEIDKIIIDDYDLAIDTTLHQEKLTTKQFAERIKEKYPAYKEVENRILVKKLLEKYPQYKEDVESDN